MGMTTLSRVFRDAAGKKKNRPQVPEWQTPWRHSRDGASRWTFDRIKYGAGLEKSLDPVPNRKSSH